MATIQIALVVAWLALLRFSMEASFWTGSIAIVVYGIVGASRRRITIQGRRGPAKTYEGDAAVREGLFVVLLGLVFAAMTLFFFRLIPMWQA